MFARLGHPGQLGLRLTSTISTYNYWVRREANLCRRHGLLGQASLRGELLRYFCMLIVLVALVAFVCSDKMPLKAENCTSLGIAHTDRCIVCRNPNVEGHSREEAIRPSMSDCQGAQGGSLIRNRTSWGAV